MKDMLGNRGKDVTPEQLKMDQFILQGQWDELRKEIASMDTKIAELIFHSFMPNSEWTFSISFATGYFAYLKGNVPKDFMLNRFDGMSMGVISSGNPKESYKEIWMKFKTSDDMKAFIRKYNLKVSFEVSRNQIFEDIDRAAKKLENVEDWADWYEELRNGEP